MDIVGKLMQNGGCTADGTVSGARNPLNKLIDSTIEANTVPAHANDQFPEMNAVEQNFLNAHTEAQFIEQQNFHAPQFHRIPPSPHAQGFSYDKVADNWVQEFHPRNNMEKAFSDASARSNLGPQLQHMEWVNEYQQSAHYIQHQRLEDAWHSEHHGSQIGNRSASAEMVRTMSANPDPRWQQSEFLQFMGDVSTGKVELTENTVVEGKEISSLDSAWNGSKALEPKSHMSAIQGELEDTWNSSGVDLTQSPSHMLNEAWESSQLKESELEAIWENAVAEAKSNGPFEEIWNNVETSEHENISSEYHFTKNNPYLEHENPFQEGMRLFQAGEINEAILAFEAEVQQRVEHSESWRMLGECHAENDEDKKAIACLERAVDHDPYNLSAVLSLGVSYVNELDSHRALHTLKSWVRHNPKFHGLEIRVDEYSDGSLMDDVMNLMSQAEAFDPTDPDVQVVLGVLYNVSKDYDAAVASFRATVDSRPDDYTLWNKLGATLANSNRSEEAMPAYHRALELKPKYARGWLNLGISHANLGQYFEAARCYLQALVLNPDASHIWSYLRIAFTCMDRFDLVKKADTQDLGMFREEFSLINL